MNAEYPGASWVPIPGFGFPNGAHDGNDPKWIVLHGTSSTGATAADIAHYFQGDNQNGTHFVIGKDGTVIQMVALLDAAYGNGGPTQAELQAHAYADFWNAQIAAGINLNTVTISIEHCKDSGNLEALTPAQQDASFKLVAWLCKALRIPAHAADASGGITGHNSINGIERAMCPGPYPWQQLFSYLANGGSMAPEGWTDDGAILTAPNKIPVDTGFRTWIETHSWDPSNWPLAPGFSCPVQVSPVRDFGPGSRLDCSMISLGWTSTLGVFVIPIGEELAAAKAAPPPAPLPLPVPDPKAAAAKAALQAWLAE